MRARHHSITAKHLVLNTMHHKEKYESYIRGIQRQQKVTKR